MVNDIESGESARGRLSVYRVFDRLPFLRGKYARKFAAATAVAAVPPLVTLILYIFFSNDSSPARNQLLPALGLTYLAGFMATLWLHRCLLAPVELSAATIKDYLDERLPPDLPGEYRDEAGRLMGRTQYLLKLFQRWGMRLESLSDLDELTGVYNRRAGEKRLAEEVARAERDLESFHLAMVDVRGFRDLCEAYGYETGDIALIHLVGALIANTRRGDWIAKWGTNQFLIGLHRNRNAPLVMSRIIDGIESLPCPLPKDGKLQLRVGCASIEYQFGRGEARSLDLLGEVLGEAKRRARPEGPSICVSVAASELAGNPTPSR